MSSATRATEAPARTPWRTATVRTVVPETPSAATLVLDVEDCRWTPCYDCGVCPEMNTEIQIGPTGRQILPLSVV